MDRSSERSSEQFEMDRLSGYSLIFKIKKLTQEINKLWNIRAQEDDPAVRNHQTELYNQKVEQLNDLRLLLNNLSFKKS